MADLVPVRQLIGGGRKDPSQPDIAKSAANCTTACFTGTICRDGEGMLHMEAGAAQFGRHSSAAHGRE